MSIILDSLIEKQNCKCYYCGTKMNTENNNPAQATIEHLIDKWSSPNHRKIEDETNLVAACFACNNARGNIRNRIARQYYQKLFNKNGIKRNAASVSSRELYKMFGPVPQHLFECIK